VGIDEVGGQWQASRQGRFGVQAGQQAIHRFGGPGGIDGGLQVPAGDVAGLPLLAETVARHQHRAARQRGQLRGGRGDGALQLTPIGVDRDEAVQRPGGRDACAGTVDVGLQRGR